MLRERSQALTIFQKDPIIGDYKMIREVVVDRLTSIESLIPFTSIKND